MDQHGFVWRPMGVFSTNTNDCFVYYGCVLLELQCDHDNLSFMLIMRSWIQRLSQYS
eukprot:SAG11_NODE_18852_length_479_cov_39.339474_1_plen_56_part_01